MRFFVLCALVVLSSVSAAKAEEILLNGGFETGDLTSWTTLIGSGVVVASSTEMDPSDPHSGNFLFSASNADGADREGETEITLLQTIDVSGFGFISSGLGRLTAQGFFSGATGGIPTSDDTAQIIVEFFQGATLLDTLSTTAIDPIVGFWNEVGIPLSAVPPQTDTIKFRVRAELQSGFDSIDIGGDSFSLQLTAVPEPTSLVLFGAGVLALCTGRGLARRRRA